MHLGNILSAFLSWLSAKSQGGEWLLRIEDLDPGRSRPEYIRMVEEDLLWLSLEWDEGGMDNKEYCQSCRGDIYNHYFEILQARGLVYPCYCTRADLMASSAPHQSDGRVIYPGTCRPDRSSLAPGNSGIGNSTRDNGRKPAWRVMVPDEEITVTDRHYGPVTMNMEKECGDFVVRRADGTAAYQLAVVVDDALMGVTEVVRGSDLLMSSPQQAWLHSTLGFQAPEFCHLPLLCAADGRRLCKRDKDLDMEELRRRYTPEQLIGLLACLSGLQETPDAVKLKDLIPSFDWNKVPCNDIILK